MINECRECGVLIANVDRHATWHQGMSRQFTTLAELLQELGQITKEESNVT